MTATQHSMTNIDLAWLRMERATNPMVIVGVFTFDTRIKFQALRAVLETRLLKFERFRQLPVHDVLGTHWQEDVYFDLDTHVRKISLPAHAGKQDLQALAGELASTPLDARHPLWQFNLVERFGSGCAVIARFHHCYADGAALQSVVLSLTDLEPKKPQEANFSLALTAGHAAQGDSSLFALAPLFESAMSVTKNATQGTLEWFASSLRSLAHPTNAATDAVTVARQLGAAGAELAKIAMLSEDPRTPLKEPLGTIKQVAWADPLSLAEVKTIAKALDCTVNDVLLATVAGAIGVHLRQRGVQTDGLSIRAMIPVNLRQGHEADPLGNHFGLVFLNLPVGVHNPLARVYALHQDMIALKNSPQPMVAMWLLTAMGIVPAAVQERAVDLFTSKASVVISNVPGVQQPLYLAGAKIKQQFFWVPQAGGIGVGVSVFTYNGQVHFGLIADRNVIPNPQAVVDDFANEFEALLLGVVAGGKHIGGRPDPIPKAVPIEPTGVAPTLVEKATTKTTTRKRRVKTKLLASRSGKKSHPAHKMH
jgi:diacylglycerol O-acyltransferase